MYALIIADPNTDALGEVRSRHRTAQAAFAARQRLSQAEWRWAYVAKRCADGSYPFRADAMAEEA